MCTFRHDQNIKLPEEKKVIAYKVFSEYFDDPTPFSDINKNTPFKFGKNIWDEKTGKGLHDDQEGFQVFVTKEHAIKWITQDGKCENIRHIFPLCPVTIYTKDIVKVTDDFNDAWLGPYEAYEVKSFSIYKKDWKNRLKN